MLNHGQGGKERGRNKEAGDGFSLVYDGLQFSINIPSLIVELFPNTM